MQKAVLFLQSSLIIAKLIDELKNNLFITYLKYIERIVMMRGK